MLKGILSLLLVGLLGAEGLVKMLPAFNEVIENSFIVVFHPEVDFEEVSYLAKSYNAKHTLHIGNLKAFGGSFTFSEIEKLRTFDNLIRYIEPNQVIRTQYETQYNATWGLDRIDQEKLPLDNLYRYSSSSGRDVDIYVIDTGILLTHEEFEGRAVSGYDFHNDDDDATDDNGHGTHCASTSAGKVYGVAKNANLIAVKTLGRFGAGNLLNVAKGVEFAANRHSSTPGKKSVANMSLGGGVTQVLDEAVEEAIKKGLVVAAASGNNDGDACFNSPARVETAITVNAMNRNDTRASFSNWGECTDIFAPGQDITAAWISSDNSYRTISGTSMACPHVVGSIAAFLGENPLMTPAQVWDNLKAVATNGAISDVKGSPNRLLFSPFR